MRQCNQHDKQKQVTTPENARKMTRPIEFKSHIVGQEGEIMANATRDVIAVPPSISILEAVETMTVSASAASNRRCRSKKVRGTYFGDIINFLGGADNSTLSR